MVSVLEYVLLNGIDFFFTNSKGCPVPNSRHCDAIAEAALNILDSCISGFLGVDVQIGIHTGTVASGIIGAYSRKWSVFSDSVNVASRMASSSLLKKIQISAEAKELLDVHGDFVTTYRGIQVIKGKVEILIYKYSYKIINKNYYISG